MLSFIRSLFTAPERRALTVEIGQQSGLLDGPTRSGVNVSELNALGVSSVWAAVRVISEAVGSLPLLTYEKTDDGRELADDHPLADLLNVAPNPEQTRPVFWETLMSHALLWGTAYAEIERNGAGDPIALWPIHPRWVLVERNVSTGELAYRVTLPINTIGDPSVSGNVVTLGQEDMLAVPGLGADGAQGYSILKLARENLAYTISLDRFGQAYFGNNARLASLLKTPNRLSDEGRENLRKSFHGLYGGVDNSGKTAVLEEGLTFEAITYSDDGGLYDNARKFQVREVCRLFNISPVKLGEVEGLSQYKSLATLQTAFWVDTIRPWAVKIEAETQRKLFGLGSDYYCEFDTDDILRGDIDGRYQAYSVGIQAGFLQKDEVRAWENLPPLPPEPEPKPAPPMIPQDPSNPNPAQENDGDEKSTEPMV